MTARTSSPAADRARGLVRLTGVDAARGLALLGMMATHLMPTFEPNAQLTPTWVGLVFSGRASALFAVLAGVGLALLTGRNVPLRGYELNLARRGIALRALVIAVIGLTLGGLDVNVAIILVHYALLFLCVLPFLGLRAKHLVAWAGGWILLAPVVAYVLRPWFLAGEPPLHLGHNPSWEDLVTPAPLLGDLFLTGYYPVLQWLAYLLVGLAIGRLPLDKARVAWVLLVGGATLGFAAKALGDALINTWGGLKALRRAIGDSRWPLESLLQVNLTGIEQTGSWWWLATAAPHSGTTLDLLHSAAVAGAVLGACLLLGALGSWLNLDLLLPLRGAGAMTLTLYTVHVWALAGLYAGGLPRGWTDDGMYAAQAATAVAVGMLFAVLRRRGPLEQVAHAAHAVGARPLSPVQ